MSHSESSGSAATSTAPSATQHVGPEVAEGAGAPHAIGQAEERLAPADGRASRPATSRTGSRRRARPTRETGAGAAPRRARAARRRRRGRPTSGGPAPGAETTPSTASSPSSSAIRVAHTGTPRTKFFVPSIGSMTQRRAPCPSTPNSSPETASSGRSRASRRADRLLHGAVGVADRGQVGLGLDHEVGRAEAVHGDRVGGVGEAQREREVVGVGGHDRRRWRRWRVLARGAGYRRLGLPLPARRRQTGLGG